MKQDELYREIERLTKELSMRTEDAHRMAAEIASRDNTITTLRSEYLALNEKYSEFQPQEAAPGDTEERIFRFLDGHRHNFTNRQLAQELARLIEQKHHGKD